MEFKTTEDLSSSVYKDSLSIRKTVFVVEQKVDVSLEIDDLESSTLHLVGYSDGTAACTARLLLKDNNSLKIQRVAVLEEYRKKGIGSLLMTEVEKIAQEHFNSSELVLDAQDHAIPFYLQQGFSISSGSFLDAGIPHHQMKKAL